MYLKVRNIVTTSGTDEIFVTISKMAKISELKEVVRKKMNVEVENQVLFYKGKLLVDDHKILDYDIQLNDVIQLMIKKTEAVVDIESKQAGCNDTSDDGNAELDKKEEEKELFKVESKFFKVEDLVDILNKESGAWNEGILVDILSPFKDSNNDETELIFKVKAERGELNEVYDVKLNEIRPRSFYKYKKSELEKGMTVLASYNMEEPLERGYWYDCEIEDVSDKGVIGTIIFGEHRDRMPNCIIKYNTELFRIETSLPHLERTNIPLSIPLRKQAYNCNKCQDIPTRNCKKCGCTVCGGKHNPDKIMICDECDDGFHLECLNPPLTAVPPGDWYCPECKNDENEIVKAGEKLKYSSKKAKMASNKASSNSRDWGSGMACAGRMKECTIVPKDHYGPVPGVEVGTCWKFRLQVSEAGIHRPHVAGIHGRESDGAYSLVLSGGYEDDIDYGEEFYYTGSGGRDLSGNKRVNDQSSDQKLTRMNKALALNCNAKFNDKTGAEAKNWKEGKPVRVVRNYKLGKHSKFAPKDGNRYDGIYKVVKYYPEKGKSGFIVWRYLLRRDDPNPAPWNDGGLELEMLYPPGYLEAQQAEQQEKEEKNKSTKKESEKTSRKSQNNSKRNSKRKLTDFFATASSNTPNKKQKSQEYTIPEDIMKAIRDDVPNEKLWKECEEEASKGKQTFLKKVEELFMCICCQEVVYQPITIECSHNVCKSCLVRSFKSEIYNCPYCRFNLGADYKMKVNSKLNDVLHLLFPGYEAGR